MSSNRGTGADRVGNQQVRNTPSSTNRSAFGGAGSGMSGSQARASSSRGSSSMGGSRGGGAAVAAEGAGRHIMMSEELMKSRSLIAESRLRLSPSSWLACAACCR